jgi:TonB family protein
MQLLNKMDRVVGPGVIDRPMFAIPEETKQVPTQKSKTLGDTSAGKYDELFRGAPEKPSDLYRAAQINPPVPTVRLMSSTPFRPDVMIQPDYPPLARVAHIEGIVTFTADVGPDGSTANFSVQNGHPMLRSATEKAVSAWKFSTQAAGQRIHVAIEFATNCSARKE